jgi:DNA-binding NarL/FixJ family response regulator
MLMRAKRRDVNAKLRVAVADDHAAMLEWLTATLRKEFEVVASVNNGAAALEAVARFDPDVIVLDLAMSPVNGLEVTRSLRQSGARTGVVLVTAYDEPELMKVGLDAGAQGFVVKSRVIEELAPAVRKAAPSRRHSATSDI